MKKVLKGILAVLFFYIFLSLDVCAEEIAWKDITNKLKQTNSVCAGSCANIEVNDNSVVIEKFFEEFGINLSSTFQYSNNIISLNVRDISSLTDLQRVEYAMVDNYSIDMFLDVICDLYGIDKAVLSSKNYLEYGIEYEFESVIYQEDGSDKVYNENFVKKFSVNNELFLKKVDELNLDDEVSIPVLLEDNDGEMSIQIEPSIELKEVSKTDNAISLIINVNNLKLKGDTVKATCSIYTKRNGIEKIVDTIECMDGENTYKVSGLKSSESYSFYGKLNYEYKNTSGEIISGNVDSSWIKVDTNLSNPKTGVALMYVVLLIFGFSCFSIFIMYIKMNKENVI